MSVINNIKKTKCAAFVIPSDSKNNNIANKNGMNNNKNATNKNYKLFGGVSGGVSGLNITKKLKKRLHNSSNEKEKEKDKVINLVKMRKNKMSNNVVESIGPYSCFTRSGLLDLIVSWNKKNPLNKIVYNKKMPGKELWKLLKNKMDGICDDEYCWIDKTNINPDKAEKLKKHFKPEMPKDWLSDDDKWLTTLDIAAVIEPYEKKYENFEFIGPVPIDFDTKINNSQCVNNQLCSINLSSMANRGKNKIGVVFNLDKHNQSGSHWIAMFMSLPDKSIYFWDSFANSPPAEVVNLMNKLKLQAEKLGIKLKQEYNKIRHQYKNTECGVYCIHFIISLLEGQSFASICKNVINDEQMNSYRKIFFKQN